MSQAQIRAREGATLRDPAATPAARSHMDGRIDTSWGRAELLYVIRRVRQRWRLKLALRGLAAAGVATLIALAIAATVASTTLERWDFPPQLALALRVGLGLAVSVALIGFLIVPLRRRVSDDRVALYLEEHESSLDAVVLSAIEAVSGQARTGAPLASRTIEAAIERCRAIDNGVRVERRGLRRHAAALVGLALAAWAFAALGPATLRHGLSLLLFPAPGAAAVTPISLDVLPGDTTIARGADQVITARLEGFVADAAELVVHSASDSTAERLYMAAGDEARDLRPAALRPRGGC